MLSEVKEARQITLTEGRYIASQVEFMLHGIADEITTAGDVRRQTPYIKSISVVCLPRFDESEADLFGNTVRKNKVIGWLNNIASITPDVKVVKGGERYQQFLYNGYTVNLYMPVPEEFGRILALKTGGPVYAMRINKRCVELGYNGVNGRLTNLATGVADMKFPTEKSFFKFLGWEYIKPEARL